MSLKDTENKDYNWVCCLSECLSKIQRQKRLTIHNQSKEKFHFAIEKQYYLPKSTCMGTIIRDKDIVNALTNLCGIF